MDKVALLPAEDRAALFGETGAGRGVANSIIEKDFWGCWTLKRLFALQRNDTATLCVQGRHVSELKVNIDDPKYTANGGSKGKRLRYLLQSAAAAALRTLTALWEHRSGCLALTGGKDPVVNAETRYQALINRLSGGVDQQPATHSAAASTIDRQNCQDQVGPLAGHIACPHARGYAFEGFLKDLFNGFGLAAQGAFPAPR